MGVSLPDIEIYNKVTIITIVWNQCRNRQNRSVEQKDKAQNKSRNIQECIAE